MCSVCNQYRCHPSCPNAPEAPRYGRCKICKDEIIFGEEIVEIDDKTLHYDCLTVTDMLEVLGVKVKYAGDV